MCWTNRPSGCIRATIGRCSIRSTGCAAKRNTLVVVEHDEETIRRADHVHRSGSGRGVRGGELVAAGTVRDLIANPRSVTGRFLRAPLLHPARRTAR